MTSPSGSVEAPSTRVGWLPLVIGFALVVVAFGLGATVGAAGIDPGSVFRALLDSVPGVNIDSAKIRKRAEATR